MSKDRKPPPTGIEFRGSTVAPVLAGLLHRFGLACAEPDIPDRLVPDADVDPLVTEPDVPR